MKIFKLGLVYLIALAIASIGVGSFMLPKASAAETTKKTPPKEPTTPITLRKAGGTQQEFTSAPQKTTGAGKVKFNEFTIKRN